MCCVVQDSVATIVIHTRKIRSTPYYIARYMGVRGSLTTMAVPKMGRTTSSGETSDMPLIPVGFYPSNHAKQGSGAGEAGGHRVIGSSMGTGWPKCCAVTDDAECAWAQAWTWTNKSANVELDEGMEYHRKVHM